MIRPHARSACLFAPCLHVRAHVYVHAGVWECMRGVIVCVRLRVCACGRLGVHTCCRCVFTENARALPVRLLPAACLRVRAYVCTHASVCVWMHSVCVYICVRVCGLRVVAEVFVHARVFACLLVAVLQLRDNGWGCCEAVLAGLSCHSDT